MVKADLPGLTQEDIKISLSNDVLTIEGAVS
ncbi:Hsp20/alpha crystallin family protein [Candidatus Poribacteria bacterium]|nr:Hsp20/alpha crystallin family protein [Candidatus Poribacteria bacterium]